MVKGFFSAITRKRIRRGVFKSVADFRHQRIEIDHLGVTHFLFGAGVGPPQSVRSITW